MTIDPVLRGFVDYADMFDTEDLPITLTVKGQIITGRLISQQRYHAGLKKTFGVKEGFAQEMEMITPPEYIQGREHHPGEGVGNAGGAAAASGVQDHGADVSTTAAGGEEK